MEHLLYPHQSDTLNEIRETYRAGYRTPLLYAPTGFGKTEIAIAMLSAAEQKGNRAAMVLDRIALCNQTSARLDKYSLEHGVLQSGHYRYRPDRHIQVCSAQTLEASGSFPGLNLLIVDECHAQRRETVSFVRNNRSVKVVGLSASPFSDGLANTYDCVVSTTTTKWLVENGYLCGLRVFISKEIDMSGAKKIAGEWSQKEATERGIRITGDIVSEWIKKTHETFGGPRKTIVFCAGVAHGNDLSNKFAEAGYNFVSISYRDDDDFKKQAIEEFAKPDSSIHGLIATDILTKGFDCPDVMIGISARPFSKSFSSHVQQMGRVMRSFPEKEFALWLDFSGNYLRFRESWEDLYENGVRELHDGKDKPRKEPSEKEKERAKCPTCGHLWPGGYVDVCPSCGHVRVRRNDVIEVPGELLSLDGGSSAEKYSSDYKREFYEGLLFHSRSKGMKDGWAYYQYIEKFKCAPPWKKQTREPSQDVVSYIRHKNIKYAKGRANAV